MRIPTFSRLWSNQYWNTGSLSRYRFEASVYFFLAALGFLSSPGHRPVYGSFNATVSLKQNLSKVLEEAYSVSKAENYQQAFGSVRRR